MTLILTLNPLFYKALPEKCVACLRGNSETILLDSNNLYNRGYYSPSLNCDLTADRAGVRF
jgi:hypothetical protein